MLETRDFIFSLVLQFLHAHNPKVTLKNNFRKLRFDLDPAREAGVEFPLVESCWCSESGGFLCTQNFGLWYEACSVEMVVSLGEAAVRFLVSDFSRLGVTSHFPFGVFMI